MTTTGVASQPSYKFVRKRSHKVSPRRPGDMAAVTGIRGKWMADALSSRNCTVVTVATQIKRVIMWKRRIESAPALPGSMTHIALIGGQWMITGFTGGSTSIMTATAGIGSL